MGHTYRRNDDYSYKHDHRVRDDRKLKKLNKRLRKITNRKNVVPQVRPQEGVELI
jgi:hypothetical protein